MNKIYKLTKTEALNRLKDLCSRSEKSSHDIRLKLKGWGLEKEEDNIVALLMKEQFIDDLRYARAYTMDKIRLNKWGKLKVVYLLKSRQIDLDIIENAISSIDPEEYRQIVFNEFSRKIKSVRINDPFLLKSKIYAFANLRGYEGNLVNEYFELYNQP